MITIEPYIIEAAPIGEPNPLPDIHNVSYIHSGIELSDEITAKERSNIGKGMLQTLLPYKQQDSYSRERSPREFRAAVLENSKLRAVFLPEVGGRLWSLWDKRLGRELLFRNPVFQPANLGLRNAWFAGGVEFNVGIKGHTPLTASPLFCEIAETDDGEVLSFYEYERIRGVVYTVSAWLPEDSEVLYLRCRIENTSDSEKYMYWWSNIAVPERTGTRVIVPAAEAFECRYDNDHYRLQKTSVPYRDGTDISFPAKIHDSRDFFYKLGESDAKWIAAAEPDRKGLLQCSTDRRFGRKLFLWGQSQDGRNWNEFLSREGESYIEIQAGLAHTQLEHIPMPANSEWEWVEAYTALDCEQDTLYGEYSQAVSTIGEYLTSRVGDPHSLYFPDEKGVKNRRLVMSGSGWGAIENRVRKKPVSRYHHFPLDKSDPETSMWHELLNNGRLPEPEPTAFPISYVSGEPWLGMLEAERGKGWYAYYQLGITRYAAGDIFGAKAALEKSLRVSRSAWALRSLAMIYKNELSDITTANGMLLEAIKLVSCRQLYAECAAVLTSVGGDSEWLDIFDSLTETLKSDGRLRFYRALALLNLDRTDEAIGIINPDFMMSDIKEGELSVSEVWARLYGRIVEKRFGKRDDELRRKLYPLPKKLDFRMHADD